jgi:hypothetical protein
MARGLVAITATPGTTMRLADIKKKSSKELETLPASSSAIQESFKLLVMPTK